jgi:hypothetical protein
MEITDPEVIKKSVSMHPESPVQRVAVGHPILRRMKG